MGAKTSVVSTILFSICNITDLSQEGVAFKKRLQKHVISGSFGLFYMPHKFLIRRNWSRFLWVKESSLS